MSVLDGASQNTGDGGTGNASGSGDVSKPAWIEQLPEAMRKDESLYGFKTIGDLVAAHKTVSSEREGMIRKPGENATDEERAAFRAAMGVPATPDAYKIGKPEGYPEALPYDEAVEKAYRDFALANNMTAEQAEKQWSWYHELLLNGTREAEAATKRNVEAATETLTKEWGTKMPDNMALAVRAFKHFGKGSEALLDSKVDGVKLGDHPSFIKLFFEIGRTIADDTTAPKGGVNGEGKPPVTEEEMALAMFPSMRPK